MKPFVPSVSFGVTSAVNGKAFREIVLKCAFFSLLAWLCIGLFLESVFVSLLLALFFGLVLFAVLVYLPTVRRRGHAMLVESSLPFSLMGMAVDLGLGVRFEEALEHAAQENSALAQEFRRALREMREQGATVQQALMHFSERVDSLEVKRAMALLVSVFEQGGNAVSLKMLARELLAKQRAEAREFSGRLVVYSLMFVAVSAVVPALFQSFAIVGGVVLRLTLSPEQVFFVIVLVFPALDLAALCYIRAKTPLFLRC